MTRRYAAAGGVWVLTILAAGGVVMAAPPDDPARRDGHSFGRPEQVRVKHVALELTVDFDKKELQGSATLSIERAKDAPAGAPLILDTRDLVIESVEELPHDPHLGASRVDFRLGKPNPILGRSLTIPLKYISSDVRIRYKTSPKASALQWLDPPLTASKKPFLFSQGQAIHTRSWIPLQDSPGVRVTYDATISVPKGLTAVMAADEVPAGAGTPATTFQFKMPQAIPPYLIALAVGDLAFKPLGPRTGVYAEPSVVEKAAFEFADTEEMVTRAEKRFGPYRWGRYDILVLPPSFPFGGMENPKLTFATPTVLTGDRTLVALIAHELAHSWSGNLVSNATWRDFWLNEGFTTYIERRIVEDLYGADRAGVEADLGYRELLDALDKFDEKDEVLHVNLKGRDPDEGMTRVPYEKGALFLANLEKLFGRDKFDAFLKGYFDHFAFQSVTTADFTDYLREHLFPTDPKAAKKVNLGGWLHRAGLPSGTMAPKSERLAAVDRQANGWLKEAVATKDLKTADWTTHEWLRFLRDLPPKLPTGRMAELDDAFHLTDVPNPEVAVAWLELAVRSAYEPAYPRVETLLTSVGRRKYLSTLYEALVKAPDGKARARAIYAKARPSYHPIAVESVDKIVGKP